MKRTSVTTRIQEDFLGQIALQAALNEGKIGDLAIVHPLHRDQPNSLAFLRHGNRNPSVPSTFQMSKGGSCPRLLQELGLASEYLQRQT